MSVRVNHLNDLLKQIEYYFNVMLQNKDASQFKVRPVIHEFNFNW